MAAGYTGVKMIADLVNQIIVGVTKAEWKCSTIVNFYKGKGNSLQRGNYGGLKLTDKILKISERIMEKLIRQQVDIDKMQFDFIPGEILQGYYREKCLAKKKSLNFAFENLEKAFDQVPSNVVWWAFRKLFVKELVKIVQSMLGTFDLTLETKKLSGRITSRLSVTSFVI